MKRPYKKLILNLLALGKIDYQFHDVKQIDIHNRFLHLRVS